MQLTTELAEFAGIHAGDGYLRKNKNEIEISGGFEEQEYYDAFIIPLIKNIFKIEIKGKIFLTKKTYGVNFSSKLVIETLKSLNFPKGAKSTIVQVPEKIMHAPSKIQRAFLRGYLDTDGCITFDKKIQNTNQFKKQYNYYPRILFSSVSKKLATDVQKLCQLEGFNCKLYIYNSKKKNENTKYKLQIVGIKALQRWMKLIGSNNPTKRSRVEMWEKFGFCPPNTTHNKRKKALKGELNPFNL